MVRPVARVRTLTLEAGSHEDSGRCLMAPTRQLGFTLLELLVVLAIIALGTAGVGFAMRDGVQSQLEREALRLSALLESARAQSQLSGAPVHWQVSADGFVFSGLPQTGDEAGLPHTWMRPDTQAEVQRSSSAGAAPQSLLLGPEPIIAAQSVRLYSSTQPEKSIRLATDGVRPFAVQANP